MKRRYFFFLLIFTGLASVALKLQPYSKEMKVADMVMPAKILAEIRPVLLQYDSLITREIELSGTVGAAVAVIYKGQIAFLRCYGVRKEGENDPVDASTIFRLGSVSKTVTGVLAGILSSQGILDLNKGVKDVLPGFRLKDSVNTNHLTIRNLLSHTSGLVPHAYDNLVEEHIPFNVIMDSLSRVTLSAPPGEIYSYQNVMFSLFDTISSIETSEDFGTLISEKVFQPFGMVNASTGFISFRDNPDKAYPHYLSGGGYKSLPLNDRYYNCLPAAGVNASISDMAHFLCAILDKVTFHDVLDSVLMPQIRTPLPWTYLRYWDHVDSKQYAIGWRIIGYKGRNVAYHAGYVDGYKSEIALCQDENVGIVFLTNSPCKAASVSVPAFLNLYFDYRDHNATDEVVEGELASR